MKILVNNYNETNKKENITSYPRKLICSRCNSELEYEKSDLRVGSFGCVFLDCPLCGEDNIIDNHEDSITLTKDNIEFPTHFRHTSTESGAVDVCNNEEIKKYINKAINYFRENKKEYNWYTQTGNLHVQVNRFDGDEVYDVIVTKDYYETYIPFESDDY